MGSLSKKDNSFNKTYVTINGAINMIDSNCFVPLPDGIDDHSKPFHYIGDT